MSRPKYAVATDKGRNYVHPTTGETWISITNALDMAVSKPALVPWAAKVTAESFWSRLPEAVSASMSPKSRDQFMREVKGQVRYVKDTAADLGTRVHDAAENLALGKVAVDDEEAAPYAAQVLAWFEAFGVNMDRDIEAAEATVINRDCGYAGTGDLWVHLHLAPDLTWTPRKRHLWAVDYKSSAHRPVDSTYPENGLQLAAIAHGETLLLDNGTEVPCPGPIAGTAVLNLRPNNHAFIPVPADRATAFEAFCSAVRVATYLHAATGKPARLHPEHLMPISPIILQRRLTEVGRIRIGQLVPTKSGKTRPDKLDRLRFTSSDRSLLDQIADLYGGEVKAWTPQGGGAKAWEIISDAASVPVIVPPQSVTQWMESWSGGGATRRCDGAVDMISGDACPCIAADNVICKPTTRLSVMLREVQSIGVWRLESKGWTAAAELPGMADLLARAGGYVEARLYLKAVRQVSGGETRDFMVPALAVDGVTPAQLLAGGGSFADVNGEITAPAPKAIEAAPSCDQFIDRAMESKSADDVRAIWRDASAAGCLDAEVTIGEKVMTLKAMLTTLGEGFNKAAEKVVESVPATYEDRDGGGWPPADDPADRVAVWTSCLAAAGAWGWDTDRTLTELARATSGREPIACSVSELGDFLAMIQRAEPETSEAAATLDQPNF